MPCTARFKNSSATQPSCPALKATSASKPTSKTPAPDRSSATPLHVLLENPVLRAFQLNAEQPEPLHHTSEQYSLAAPCLAATHASAYACTSRNRDLRGLIPFQVHASYRYIHLSDTSPTTTCCFPRQRNLLLRRDRKAQHDLLRRRKVHPVNAIETALFDISCEV